MFCKFLPALIILCSLSCEKTQYNFFVGAIAAKSFVHFYILTTAYAHHVVHGCNICRILSFTSSPCEGLVRWHDPCCFRIGAMKTNILLPLHPQALPRTACCFQMLFRPHQVPWTGFEGIMIWLKDKVYHLQSHPQFAQGQGNGCLERQKHDLTTIANYTVSVSKVTSATCLYLRTYVSRRESITRVNRSKN
eukprot:g73239.t1